MSIEASSSSRGRMGVLATEDVLPEGSLAAILAPGNCTTTALMLSFEPMQHVRTQ